MRRAARGEGRGPSLILRGVEQLFAESDANIVHAYVKGNNAPSVGAFQKADFRDAGHVIAQGHPAQHLLTERESP